MRMMIKTREPFTIRGGSFLFTMRRKAEKGGTNGNGGREKRKDFRRAEVLIL